MSDLNYYFDRIVTKYEPKMILVYEGDNDLNAGESPDSVIRKFKDFVRMVKTKLPKTKIPLQVAAYNKTLLETWEELPKQFITSSEKNTGRYDLLDYIDSIKKEYKVVQRNRGRN